VAQLDVVDKGQTLSFNALHGKVDGRGDRFDFIAAGRTPWAEVDGQFGIHKDAPFKLQGQFNATRKTPVPVQAALELTGELAAIDSLDAWLKA
jgi:translocation and assembly module TamB